MAPNNKRRRDDSEESEEERVSYTFNSTSTYIFNHLICGIRTTKVSKPIGQKKEKVKCMGGLRNVGSLDPMNELYRNILKWNIFKINFIWYIMWFYSHEENLKEGGVGVTEVGLLSLNEVGTVSLEEVGPLSLKEDGPLTLEEVGQVGPVSLNEVGPLSLNNSEVGPLSLNNSEASQMVLPIRPKITTHYHLHHSLVQVITITIKVQYSEGQ